MVLAASVLGDGAGHHHGAHHGVHHKHAPGIHHISLIHKTF